MIRPGLRERAAARERRRGDRLLAVARSGELSRLSCAVWFGLSLEAVDALRREGTLSARA